MNYFDELNPNQYDAVSSSSKYLRIIAGAGSGKTRVLTYRISYLIEKMNVEPYRILAITFTNKVALEMRERTARLLPDYDLSGLIISTFHSFCARFLRREIEVLQFPKNFLVIDEEDQKRLVKSIAVDFGYKKGDDVVDEALDFIAYHKTLGHLPSDINIEDLKEKQRKYLTFFKEYESRKANSGGLDFDDLIIYTIRILKTCPEVKEKYNRRYWHILVDEFQDTNDLQYELLRLLSGVNTNIFVVGDPDQTIYTWRGANQRIILDLDNDFKPVKTIILDQNYRSTSQILNAANSLIEHNLERVPKNLYTNNVDGEEVCLRSFTSNEDEAKFVARTIKTKAESTNGKYDNFAVLYRSSYLSLQIERALMHENVPYKVYGGLKFFARAEVKDALAYFRLFINEDDDISFERIMNVPRRGIGETSANILRTEALKNNISMIKYLKNIHQYETLLKGKVINVLNDLIKTIDDYRNKILTKHDEIYANLNSFLIKIDYLNYLENAKDGEGRAENVLELLEDIKAQFKAHDDMTLENYLEQVSLSTSQDEVDGTNFVKLMTVHTAKGLEFDYVFIIGMMQGVFPNQRSLNERSEEEERRLAYVAMTRAKKELYVTYNYGYVYSTASSGQPSEFIKEAKLKAQTFSFANYRVNEPSRVYKFNMNDPYEINKKPLPKNIVDLSKTNGVSWEVGDTCHHKVFGEGKVISVSKEEDIIIVDFIDFGRKTLLASHPFLTRGVKA